MRTLPPLSLALACALVLLAGFPRTAPAAGHALHLELTRSQPAADAAVSSPAEIRLWFSQVPQASATSLRLIRDGSPVAAVGDLAADPEDGKVFAAPVEETLPAGAYTVSWRTMAADGHVVRGEFTFTVQAP